MSTLVPQRTNYALNPRGRAESTKFEEVRRNRIPNPRLVSTGTAPTAYAAGVVGGTGVNRTFITSYAGFPVSTSRLVSCDSLGATAGDRAGGYFDVAAAPGEVLTASVYAARSSGAVSKRARLTVEFRSASAALASAATAATELPVFVGDNGESGGIEYNEPVRLSVTTAAAPAGTTLARVYVWAEGGATGDTAAAYAYEYSALVLEAGTAVGAYFDGASTDAPGDDYAWTGTAHASASTLSSYWVDATAVDGTPRRVRRAAAWDYVAGDATATRSAAYRWAVGGGDTVVRIQPAGGGTTPGPSLSLANDAGKAATFPATLVVVARREVAGAAVALTPVVNGVALAAQALGDEWTTYRLPVTLNGGGGTTPRNTLRLGKTGPSALLVQSVAVVDEAGYSGPYFDGDTAAVGVLASAWTSSTLAPLTSSYQGIPSVTLVAEAEPAAGNHPPRVRLTVADSDPATPVRELAVLRVDSSGRRTPVRAPGGELVELPLAATGSAVTVYDYEAPLGVGSSYVIGEAIPHIGSARVTPTDTRPWLVHPGVPARSRPLSVVRLGKRRRRVVEGVYDVVGRPDPIVRTDGKRKSAESELVLRTYTDAEREALDLLLDDTAVLLLLIPPGRGWGVTYEWVAIGDSDEDRTADTGSWPRRVWVLPYRVVGRPVGGTRSARTWHDVALEATSWRTLAAAVDSWAELADPDDPEA